MPQSTRPAPAPYVARWHSDEGFYTVLVVPTDKRLRLVVQGYPVVVKSVPIAEARHLRPLDIAPLRAARAMRKFARRNASPTVQRLLDATIAGLRPAPTGAVA